MRYLWLAIPWVLFAGCGSSGSTTDGGSDAGVEQGTLSACAVIRALEEERIRNDVGGRCVTLFLVHPQQAELPIDAGRSNGGHYSASASIHQGSCALPLFVADGGATLVWATGGSGWVQGRNEDGGQVFDLDVTVTFDAGSAWPSASVMRGTGVRVDGECP
jgi:hypothetical protein